MTIRQSNGSPGLLAMGKFGDAVNVELGTLDLYKAVKKVVDAGDQVRILSRQFCNVTHHATRTESHFCAFQGLLVRSWHSSQFCY
jgi:hypothetical protein